MSYITVQEAAEKWGVSERLVRRYCAQNRIPGLVQYDGIWQIPENAERPAPKTREPSEAPPLLKALIKQRDGRQYRGFYEYLQINMVYSSGRKKRYAGTWMFTEKSSRKTSTTTFCFRIFRMTGTDWRRFWS